METKFKQDGNRLKFLSLPALLFCVTVALADCAVTDNYSRTGPFILGADISYIPEDEEEGAQYFDHGVRKDIFELLKEYRFNYVRLRLFVDPHAPGGYAAHRKESFCDLAHVKALAKRAKAAGMGILLDIHYSDTWSSPAGQEKPSAWANMSFPVLTEAVRNFTYSAIEGLKANGTPADMVQIGNEISDGMLLPDGRRSNFDNFATLVKAGIAGAKAADPSVKIVLHHHLGRKNSAMVEWLDNFIRRGTEFDIIGMSCYAQAKEGDWKTNFDDLAKRYPDKGLLVLEYSAQKRRINDLMFNTPDKKGLGTFIWEPTRHRESLFNKNGIPAGGGQASNFVTDEGINQGATAARAKTAIVSPTELIFGKNWPFNSRSGSGRRRDNHGGRYDTNDLINLYPQMFRDYEGIKVQANGAE